METEELQGDLPLAGGHLAQPECKAAATELQHMVHRDVRMRQRRPLLHAGEGGGRIEVYNQRSR